MSPGRELDQLIAEKVMGVEPGTLRSNQFSMSATFDPKPYSTDIAAAWEVVEKNETLFKLQYDHISDMWAADFGKREEQAETVPHAICLAALALLPK